MRWEDGEGALLARFGGAAAAARRERGGRWASRAREVVEDDDAAVGRASASGQRAPAGGRVVRVSGLQTQLRLRRAARLGAAGRRPRRRSAFLGALADDAATVEALRARSGPVALRRASTRRRALRRDRLGPASIPARSS